MKVKALKRGFDGVVIREAGEVFEFKGEVGDWIVAVDEDAKPSKAAKVEESDEEVEAHEPKAHGKKK